MKNVITKGTELAHIASDPAASEIDIPVTEDWAMLMEVDSCTSGIVTAHKIWDTAGTPTPFYAKLQYQGRADTPPDTSVVDGQNVVFYRVGDYNSIGSSGVAAVFEKRAEAAGNVSFVCFVDAGPVWVEDLGDGTGKEVIFSSAGVKSVPSWSATLTMYQAEPATFFHESTIPWKTGRIYLGLKVKDGSGSAYIVDVAGHGDTAKTFSETAGGIQFDLEVDGTGNVIDFTATEV